MHSIVREKTLEKSKCYIPWDLEMAFALKKRIQKVKQGTIAIHLPKRAKSV